MKLYRAGWLSVYTAALLIGVGAGIQGPSRALPIAFVAAAVVCSVVSVGAVRLRQSGRPRGVPRARIVATCALGGGTSAMALVGLVGLLGQGVALLGVFLLVSSPSVVRTYGRWLRSIPRPSAAQLDALARVVAAADVGYVGIQPTPDPSSLTDEQLCQRWRASCLYLRRQPSASQVLREVEQRQIYLDEFERRYPGGYEAWLTSGGGTLDNLTSYVIGGRSPDATINWDELTRGRD